MNGTTEQIAAVPVAAVGSNEPDLPVGKKRQGGDRVPAAAPADLRPAPPPPSSRRSSSRSPRPPSTPRPVVAPVAPPTAPQSAPPPSPAALARPARRTPEVQAECLRLGLLPIAMAAAIDQAAFDAGGCQAYVEAELARVGNPDDPIERMFTTQAILLHVRVSLLHARAALAAGEAAKLLNSAVARLTGELRRVGLAADALRRRRQRRERRAAGK